MYEIRLVAQHLDPSSTVEVHFDIRKLSGIILLSIELNLQLIYCRKKFTNQDSKNLGSLKILLKLPAG